MDAAPIDESRVAALTSSLGGDEAAALRFVADFVAAWPERWARLQSAWQRADADEASAVLLSIQSSAAMVGAVDLADTARLLLGELSRYGALHPGTMTRLFENGLAACEALEARLGRPGGSFPPATA